jgi:chromosome segregation ATPase
MEILFWAILRWARQSFVKQIKFIFMSKEHYRNKIAKTRAEIVKLRSQIAKVKEHKAAEMERLAHTIKSASSASIKENCRKQKITKMAAFANTIESLQKKIESLNKQIESDKKKLASEKE